VALLNLTITLFTQAILVTANRYIRRHHRHPMAEKRLNFRKNEVG
jgi:hypothetical protein